MGLAVELLLSGCCCSGTTGDTDPWVSAAELLHAPLRLNKMEKTLAGQLSTTAAANDRAEPQTKRAMKNVSLMAASDGCL